MTVILAIPPVLFLAPEVAGRVFLDGDNLLQNFPLRMLTAHDLQHGHLPLLNPYLFGGTPLLGGFNAGAAYPTTWLLAVLPSFEAWSLNLAIAYDLAALGTYLLLRRQSLSATAATFAAATFAFAGYMSGQLIHVDLIEGAAWLPWTLLAVDSLLPAAPGRTGPPVVRHARPRSLVRWAALLVVVVALTILTGGAEAIIDGLLGVVVYALWQLVSQGRRGVGRWDIAASAAWVAGGVAGGVALGTAQWLPGIVFTSQSQRAATSYAYFTTGSLDYHLLVLMVSPFVLGTNQNRPALYVGQYNFPEVTSYMGILALIAVTTLWSRRFRQRPEARSWWVWYAVGAVGLLSALGGETPFARILYLVPLVRDERLLNRNLLLVDFAFAALLGWWLNALLQRALAPSEPVANKSVPASADEPEHHRRRWARAVGWSPGRRAEIMLTCAPAAIILVVAVASWADGRLVLQLLNAEDGLPVSARFGVAGVVTAGAVVAIWATVIVLRERHLGLVALRRRLGVVLVVDLALFTAFVLQAPITGTAAQAQTPSAAALARYSAGGRFIIYDPDRFEGTQLLALGQTDLNVFPSTPSGQGYTALTGRDYYQATGAHYQEDFDPASLRGPVWDNLDVTTFLSLPSYFVTPLGPQPGGTSVPFSTDPSAERRDYTGAPLPTDNPVVLRPGRSHTWYLGAALNVSRWSIGLDRGRGRALQAGAVTVNGSVQWTGSTSTSRGRTLTVVPTGGPIAGIVVRNRSSRSVVLQVPDATTAQAGPVALNGRMQYGVYPSHWRFVTTLGSFGVFANTRARGAAWITPTAGGGEPGPGTSVTTAGPSPDGAQIVTVRSATPVDLVRSMAYSPGWHATARPLERGAASVAGAGSGALTPRRLTVTADGLVQRVSLPAGNWAVDFTYRPASAVTGLIVSAVAAAFLLGWAIVDVVLVLATRRRRRHAPARGG